MRLITFGVMLTGLAGAICGCNEDDIGIACGLGDGAVLPTEPVVNEEPVGEIVSVRRDGVCETFQCLRHRGYAPYCTRECSAQEDCPKGFECDAVQSVGPLADKKFCVVQEGCEKNIDCEDLGNIECVKVGCYDSQLRTGDTTEGSVLTCEPMSSLDFCRCSNGSDNCSDASLICAPENEATWPEESVEQRSLCQRK